MDRTMHAGLATNVAWKVLPIPAGKTPTIAKVTPPIAKIITIPWIVVEIRRTAAAAAPSGGAASGGVAKSTICSW